MSVLLVTYARHPFVEGDSRLDLWVCDSEDEMVTAEAFAELMCLNGYEVTAEVL